MRSCSEALTRGSPGSKAGFSTRAPVSIFSEDPTRESICPLTGRGRRPWDVEVRPRPGAGGKREAQGSPVAGSCAPTCADV